MFQIIGIVLLFALVFGSYAIGTADEVVYGTADVVNNFCGVLQFF